MSKISWTNETWNPIVGCSIVSPGCHSCYAMKMAWRLEHGFKTPHYAGTTKKVNGKAVWTGTINLAPEHIMEKPLWRKKPTMYFVNSMSDLFHEDVPGEWIDDVFETMGLSPQHTFQVLTKRPERMRAYFSGWTNPPLPNVWLGTSVEDQRREDRVQHLRDTPAAVRFISYEPALEQVDFDLTGIDWLISGDESGPGKRQGNLDWHRSARDQCAEAHVDYFLKQIIRPDGKKVEGPHLDGRQHLAMPGTSLSDSPTEQEKP